MLRSHEFLSDCAGVFTLPGRASGFGAKIWENDKIDAAFRPDIQIVLAQP
jgi:hypothetical protein